MNLPALEMGFHLNSLLINGTTFEQETTQAIAKSIGFSLKLEGRAVLLKTTPRRLIKHGEAKLVPTKNLHS